jgi:plasmid stabilization system protein ParE
VDTGDGIGLFPEAGRVIARKRGYAIREQLFNTYRLLYLIQNDACHIVGILHGSRDLMTWLAQRAKEFPIE